MPSVIQPAARGLIPFSILAICASEAARPRSRGCSSEESLDSGAARCRGGNKGFGASTATNCVGIVLPLRPRLTAVAVFPGRNVTGAREEQASGQRPVDAGAQGLCG